MHPDCLQHLLTDNKRELFNTQGFLVVELSLIHI